MYKRIILIVCLALAFSTAGYAFAQELGGGGLMFEPPFLTAQVADQAVSGLKTSSLARPGRYRSISISGQARRKNHARCRS